MRLKTRLTPVAAGPQRNDVLFPLPFSPVLHMALKDYDVISERVIVPSAGVLRRSDERG